MQRFVLDVLRRVDMTLGSLLFDLLPMFNVEVDLLAVYLLVLSCDKNQPFLCCIYFCVSPKK